ncbi:MAG TPA: DUF433 domain-containing protein [Leptospiraceae bacterium]|nr:DUF433 domain-containing protein [Leptospiraceae bacterium]HRG77746.1 DUF433 domain-containing protein [Leptospiraceae bacterium]
MKMHWEKIVFSSPEVLGGTPVFKGTRVPVLSLLEHLENGISLDEFIEDFPSVDKFIAIQFLKLVKETTMLDLSAA